MMKAVIVIVKVIVKIISQSIAKNLWISSPLVSTMKCKAIPSISKVHDPLDNDPEIYP